MSQYGTSGDYCTGYDEGAEETAERYDALMVACIDLLKVWGENKNLSVPIQALAAEVANLKDCRRLELDSTTYPESRRQ